MVAGPVGESQDTFEDKDIDIFARPRQVESDCVNYSYSIAPIPMSVLYLQASRSANWALTVSSARDVYTVTEMSTSLPSVPALAFPITTSVASATATHSPSTTSTTTFWNWRREKDLGFLGRIWAFAPGYWDVMVYLAGLRREAKI